jgi:CheY-like chemotaxis protein
VARVRKKDKAHRVLIIDDEPQVRISLRETLEAAGYEVVEAENGMVAVDYMSDVKPDVMITDIFMPEKEGIATIRDYRSMYPDLPIIAISGANSMAPKGFLEAAEKLGADHTLAKPFGPHELLNIVRQALNDR